MFSTDWLSLVHTKTGVYMADLAQMAKTEYDSLIKQLETKENEVADLKKKIHPIGIFLKESGVLEKETRKREKK